MAPATNSSKIFEHPSPAKRLRDAQEKLLRDGQGDLTIQCGEKTWKCSAIILAQRCEFFRAATSGSFMESETKTVKFNDETIVEVDMLLTYLYTLDDPKFEDKAIFKYSYSAAESALKLGDKYNLPDLGAAGYRALSECFRKSFRDWGSKTEDSKLSWLRRVKRLWTSDYTLTDVVWKVAIEQLIAMAGDIIEYEPFQKLCEEHPDFALEFMRAQAKAAEDLRGSTLSKQVISTSVTSDPIPPRHTSRPMTWAARMSRRRR